MLSKKIIIGFLMFQIFMPACFPQADKDETPIVQQNVEAAEDEDRLPFMQKEKAEVSKTEPESSSLFLKTLGATILIVGLIFLATWGLKKVGFGVLQSVQNENVPELTILSTVSLGNGRSIVTARFGERVLLIGSTAQNFTLLADEFEHYNFPALENSLSVKEMLNAESESPFAETLSQAKLKLNFFEKTGEQTS